jgi:ribosomal protein S18 acetylase RimI-like enzyme
MITRDVTTEDAELVYRIKETAYAEYAIRSRGNWDEAFQRAYTRKNLSHTKLIYDGPEVIGWIAREEGERNIELIDIHILPTHQGKGVGTALIEELVARGNSVRKPVELSVLKINPSRALYERLDFKPVGETETHVLMRKVPAA